MPRIPNYENRIAPQVVSPGQVESAAGIVGGIGRIASSQMGAAADSMAGMSDEFKAKARLAEMERDKQSNIEISSALANATLAKQDLANTLLANKGANAAKNVETWDTLSKAKDEEALSMVSLPTARIKAEEMLRRDTIARRGVVQSHQIGELQQMARATSVSAGKDLTEDDTFDLGIWNSNIEGITYHATNLSGIDGMAPGHAVKIGLDRYASNLADSALKLNDPARAQALLKHPVMYAHLSDVQRAALNSIGLQGQAEAVKNWKVQSILNNPKFYDSLDRPILERMQVEGVQKQFDPSEWLAVGAIVKDAAAYRKSIVDTKVTNLATNLSRTRTDRYVNPVNDALLPIPPTDYPRIKADVLQSMGAPSLPPEIDKMLEDKIRTASETHNDDLTKASKAEGDALLIAFDQMDKYNPDADAGRKRQAMVDMVKKARYPANRATDVEAIANKWGINDSPARIAESKTASSFLMSDLINLKAGGVNIRDRLSETVDGQPNPLFAKYMTLRGQEMATVQKFVSGEIELDPGYSELNAAVQRKLGPKKTLYGGDTATPEDVMRINNGLLNFAMLTGADPSLLKDPQAADVFLGKFMNAGGLATFGGKAKVKAPEMLNKVEVVDYLYKTGADAKLLLPPQVLAMSPEERQYIRQGDLSDKAREYISLYRTQFTDSDEYEAYAANLAADMAQNGKKSDLAKINAEFAQLKQLAQARQAEGQKATLMREAEQMGLERSARNTITPSREAELNRQWEEKMRAQGVSEAQIEQMRRGPRRP